MKVLILAAGYGTRLYSIVKDTPKALLEINKKPLINYILEKVKHLKGLNEVLVVTNAKFDTAFQAWAKAQTNCSCPITIVNDGTKTPEERLGSIGDIHFTLKQKAVADDLLVVGSDNLFDYNIDEYVRFAQSKSDSVSIGLYDIHDFEAAKQFGIVAVDNKGKIISFEEKPEKPKSTLAAMCFYYLPKNSLGLIGQYLIESGKSDKAGDYIRWLCDKKDVYGFKFVGKWYDIGSVEAYEEAQKNFF